jgi:hypothetical protein
MLACSKECPGSLNFGSSTNIEDKKETISKHFYGLFSWLRIETPLFCCAYRSMCQMTRKGKGTGHG